MTKLRYVFLLSIAAARLFAQAEASGETTRQLYYLAVKPEENLPPVSAKAQSQAPANTGAVHLGFRYNLVLNKGNNWQRVAADRVLQPGDCFALELEANRSAYLYVLARQSSGAWVPLLPSAQMPDENTKLDPKNKVRVPKSYCFEIHNPPGTETLFVVLSRDPRDFLELYESIKAGDKGEAQTSAISSAVEHMNERFATRDIAIRKLDVPTEGDEGKGSVYVVNTSGKPATSVVAEIKIRHK